MLDCLFKWSYRVPAWNFIKKESTDVFLRILRNIFYNICERLLQNVKSLELQNHKKQYAKETSWVIIYTEAFVCVLSVCGEKRPNILSNFLTQSVHFNFISEICFKRHIKRKFIIRLSCVVLARTTDVSFNQTHIPKDLLF